MFRIFLEWLADPQLLFNILFLKFLTQPQPSNIQPFTYAPVNVSYIFLQCRQMPLLLSRLTGRPDSLGKLGLGLCISTRICYYLIFYVWFATFAVFFFLFLLFLSFSLGINSLVPFPFSLCIRERTVEKGWPEMFQWLFNGNWYSSIIRYSTICSLSDWWLTLW